MKKHIMIAVLSVLALFTSCETTDLDKTQNPNALTPESANTDFFLNSIQEDFVRQLEGDADNDPNDNWPSGGAVNGDGFSIFGAQLTRMMAMTNTNSQNYAATFQPTDFDDEWLNAYTGIIKDIRTMTPLAEEAGQTRHIGIGQFIEAYTMVTLVDFFGDVPYSEAFQGEEAILNPNLDSGADIYDAALVLLDNAIANFTGGVSTEPALDVFYDNDYSKWVKAANTLKMRIYLQRRLVDPNAMSSFNAIVNSGNYIQDTSDDFEYQWPGTNASNPDSRHPRYGLNYTGVGVADFQSNWFMNLMDTTDDPRIRYYFYRQVNAVPGQEIPSDQSLIRCSTQQAPQHYIDGGYVFCNLPNGYWGRDHGQNDGRDPDAFHVTAHGVYPAGGKFDDNRFEGVSLVTGGQGAGITPILTAAWVDFMKAEMALANGATLPAKTAMMDGISKSITKVQSFGALDPEADLSFEPSATDVSDYIDAVSANWDAASTAGKWDVLAEQFFIATYGNGVESYNFYRRTGFPTTLQPNRSPSPGTFVRSIYYPAIAATTNSNIQQKSDQTQPVFWDSNAQPPAAN
ncbi:SusD/RagB family nutrient-binding outer membrane lipoprotein [Galbibacter sp. EGI 63066]|uniref:SusD/RagB family nutrient-binding outer membrane lipoprotein n=1 Tax=Galbibacter sp. EGI 63066 TaxID=2993559 RepID=UPI0022495E6A|nr:SusD/RagB family nutrient-binding outer membrane lipoprotein [Galbibacter sp. EGI 63066]MCX2679797.1 SusD/RagB family nutrient-binding outer membrane lipoprotein [Galbibacter sp. EGI 63066]